MVTTCLGKNRRHVPVFLGFWSICPRRAAQEVGSACPILSQSRRPSVTELSNLPTRPLIRKRHRGDLAGISDCECGSPKTGTGCVEMRFLSAVSRGRPCLSPFSGGGCHVGWSSPRWCPHRRSRRSRPVASSDSFGETSRRQSRRRNVYRPVVAWQPRCVFRTSLHKCQRLLRKSVGATRGKASGTPASGPPASHSASVRLNESRTWSNSAR